MRRVLIISTGLAVALASVISVTTGIPFLLPLAVFLFWGPLNALLCEWIASRNPLVQEARRQNEVVGTDSGQDLEPKSLWMPAVVTLLFLSIVGTAIGVWAMGARAWDAFAYSSMLVAFALAVNGLVIELEDNARGGWLRPDTWNGGK